MPDIISRQEAIEKGKVRYFTGEPCVYGHIAERYVRNKNCLECAKLSKRLSNIDLKRENIVRYFTGNPCVRGHVSERYTANNACVECHREDRMRAYYSIKYQPTPNKVPRFTIESREPIMQLLFAELELMGLSMRQIAKISNISESALRHLIGNNAPYSSRLDTAHKLAYVAGATLCLKMADGRIIDPMEISNADKSTCDVC